MAISHPGRISDELERIDRAKMRAEMEHLQKRVERLSNDLTTIFDGIDRGEQVDLHYPNGEVVTITRARPRKSQEA